ncbi:hypothetical protein ACXWOS_10675, partial [Streptococcus pyogenes]
AIHSQLPQEKNVRMFPHRSHSFLSFVVSFARSSLTSRTTKRATYYEYSRFWQAVQMVPLRGTFALVGEFPRTPVFARKK